MAANIRPAVWIGAGAAALAVAALAALYIGGVMGTPATLESAEGSAEDTSANTGSEAGAQTPERISAEPSPTEPQTREAGARPEASSAPAAHPAPRIDVFRLEPDGTALVAGRAASGWQVTLLLDGAPLVTFRPGGNGAFAEFVDVPGSAEPRILSLSMTGPDGGAAVAGETEIIIAPAPQIAMNTPGTSAPAPGGTSQAVPADATTEAANSGGQRSAVASATTQQAASSPAKAQTATAQPSREVPGLAALSPGSDLPGGTDDIAARPAPAAQQSGAPTVLMADAGGVRVLQSPGGAGTAPQVMSAVALDSISYSSDGAVQLSGRASGAGIVRVYLDNTPITTSRITEARTWRTDLPQVDTGIYTLRIDEVSPEGLVTSRVETPFKREDRALLAQLRDQTAASGTPERSLDALAAPVDGELPPQPTTQSAQPPIRAITVQPGNTLWAISRDTYGEGILYVRVFEANADRIRDPDLIYPGQVFELPQ